MTTSFMKNISIIVVGGLNTDIIGLGVDRIAKNGELVFGDELKIGPGGKSRNIAQMIASFTQDGSVAMVGKTSKDPYNLWKIPYDALAEAGVNMDYIKVLDFSQTNKLPGVALIAVNQQGENQIYVLPGINSDFVPHDIDEAEELFQSASGNKGILVLSLETPMRTATYAAEMANKYGLKVLIDPGGISQYQDCSALFSKNIFLMKPNEHEAQIITGIDIVDFKSAQLAANAIRSRGIQNVLITVGANGAYFFNDKIQEHIPNPPLDFGPIRDVTGCGDQVMSVLCAYISQGKELMTSVKAAICAGALQYGRAGIVPVTKAELDAYLKTF